MPENDMAGATVTTRIFKMDRMQLIRQMIKLHGRPWIIIFSAIIVISIGMAGWADPKWGVVALMGICIVAPMALAFFYIFHGLKPATVTNVMPHTLEITPQGIRVNMMEEMTIDNDLEAHIAVNDGFLRYSRFYGKKEFGSIIPGLTSIALTLKNNKEGFLWLHQKAFHSTEDFSRALDLITSGQQDSSKT